MKLKMGLLASLLFAGILATGSSETQAMDSASPSNAELDTGKKGFDPLSLAVFDTFAGPEIEGYHSCFWLGPASFETYNLAYPDEGAVYWVAKFEMPKDAEYIEIVGNYPDARYLSYQSYDNLTQPVNALLDKDIVAASGFNPFSHADKSGGTYRIEVRAGEVPASGAPQNTLYLGAEERGHVIPLALRIYAPTPGTDYTGNAGMPDVTLVMKDGQKLSGAEMCTRLKSPKPGTAGRALPSFVVDKAAYQKLVYESGAEPGFPAEAEPKWLKFWGGRPFFARIIPGTQLLEDYIEAVRRGEMPKASGFGANTHNDYVDTYLNEHFGEVLVLRAKLPTTPKHGWDITDRDYDMRYWSLCANEGLPSTRFVDCVLDDDVVLDENRFYQIVISKAANRPSNATAQCGVTWLDWGENGDGAGDPAQGFITLRNLLGDGFEHSTQNIRFMDSVAQDMGPYFPVAEYTSRNEFEALGCQAQSEVEGNE